MGVDFGRPVSCCVSDVWGHVCLGRKWRRICRTAVGSLRVKLHTGALRLFYICGSGCVGGGVGVDLVNLSLAVFQMSGTRMLWKKMSEDLPLNETLREAISSFF